MTDDKRGNCRKLFGFLKIKIRKEAMEYKESKKLSRKGNGQAYVESRRVEV